MSHPDSYPQLLVGLLIGAVVTFFIFPPLSLLCVIAFVVVAIVPRQ